MVVSPWWFLEKNIRIWKDLHEFERLGLVLSWFPFEQTIQSDL